MSARSLNKVQLIGNLTRDPELRYTPQGTAVASFGLATNRSWTPNDGGDRQEETEFHRIVAWSKLAEICSQLLHKGRKVYVEGRLQTRKWNTQDGQSRETTEVVIDNMIALGSPKGSGSYSGGGYAQDDGYQQNQNSYAGSNDNYSTSDSGANPSAPAASPAPQQAQDDADETINVDDIPF